MNTVSKNGRMFLLAAMMLLPPFSLWVGFWLGKNSPCQDVEATDIFKMNRAPYDNNIFH